MKHIDGNKTEISPAEYYARRDYHANMMNLTKPDLYARALRRGLINLDAAEYFDKYTLAEILTGADTKERSGTI